jgi:hypothetical protein
LPNCAVLLLLLLLLLRVCWLLGSLPALWVL